MISGDTLDNLVAVGTRSFEATVMKGEEYLPKIVLQYEGREEKHLVAYAGPMDGLADSLTVLTDDPIDWMALTIDTYHANTPDPVEALALAGTLRSLFEQGDPRVTEALEIIVASDDDTKTISLPYKRDGIAIEWLEPRFKTTFTEPVAALLQDTVRSSLV